MSRPTWVEAAERARTSAGYWKQPDFSCFDITGDDRVQLLQGFCTNDIAKLNPGDSCEAMILNPKGKVLGFVQVNVLDDRLWIECHQTSPETLIAHLDRYVIREKAYFESRSERTLLGIAGAACSAKLESVFSGEALSDWLKTQSSCGEISANGHLYRLARCPDWATHGVWIDSSVDGIAALVRAFEENDVNELPATVADAWRMERGTPIGGIDVTDANLPQELARDQQAISFTKGCYLGQETVARIDALGHVNRVLCGISFPQSADAWDGIDEQFSAAEPAEIISAEQSVGRITSWSYSPALQRPIALGYVRRGLHEPGQPLQVGEYSAEVIELPIKDEMA